MKLWSDLEVETLIDEISEAALEAIEQAAAEAAKAAALAALEREAVALREAAHQQAEALRWQVEAEKLKQQKIKNAVITGLVCFASGLVAGLLMSN